jgi:hypothetical protein
MLLAEAVRFELTNGLPRRQFSRLVPSTARPRFLFEPALYLNQAAMALQFVTQKPFHFTHRSKTSVANHLKTAAQARLAG